MVDGTGNKGLNILNFVPYCQANYVCVGLSVFVFNYMNVLFELTIKQLPIFLESLN